MTVQDWLGEENEIGIKIWENKYRVKNETFDGFLARISNGNEDIKQLIIDKKFLFGGRILANRGTQNLGVKTTFSNCYVLPKPNDNIESIFETGRDLARTFSYGGGVGIDLSNLSPKGTKINNAAKETSGAVSFMEFYSVITDVISQKGRRGALIISLDCSHPDLLDFINIKSDLHKVTKANISVRINKEFMQAVINDTDYALHFKREETGEVIEKVIKAKEVFMQLAKMNWKMAEPGILFWDNIENNNLLSNNPEFEYAGVNPCAEEPLPSGGSCLLGSINLAEFVINPFTNNANFNIEDFTDTIHKAVIALNEVLDEGLPLHPLQIQRDTVNDWRQIGLGIMGLSDMLIKLGFKYGSTQSLIICDLIASTLLNESLCASAQLAKQYGTYPKYNELILENNWFINRTSCFTQREVLDNGLRNSQILTIAPTGTLSTMLGVSGGIEPIFANYYTRKTQSLHNKDVVYKIYTPIVKEFMDKNNISEENLPEYFTTSEKIVPSERIKMQSVFQRYIDASISSTINLPNSATVEDIYNIYIEAYKAGLKGLTVYRAGCDREGVLVTEETKNKETLTISKRPNELIANLHKIKIKGIDYIVVVGLLDKKPYEIFCQKTALPISNTIGKVIKIQKGVYKFRNEESSITLAENTIEEKTHALFISMLLRHNVPLVEVIKTSKKVDDNIVSFTSAICRVLQKYNSIVTKEVCPECGEEIINEGGCMKCPHCGYSKCN